MSKEYPARDGDLVLFKSTNKRKESDPDSWGKLQWAVSEGGEVREYSVGVNKNDSDNEKAPSNKGEVDINGEVGQIALWKQDVEDVYGKKPYYKGNLEFDGKVYPVALWAKKSKQSGNTFLAGNVTKDEQYVRLKEGYKTKETQKPAPRQTRAESFDLDDEIPF